MFERPCWHLYKQININIISKVIVIGHCVCISENYSYFVGTAFKHWTWTRLGAPGLWCWSSQARVGENKPLFRCVSESFLALLCRTHSFQRRIGPAISLQGCSSPGGSPQTRPAVRSGRASLHRASRAEPWPCGGPHPPPAATGRWTPGSKVRRILSLWHLYLELWINTSCF